MSNQTSRFAGKLVATTHLIVLLLVVTTSFAQQKMLSGTVTDYETGEPIPFVNIIIKHTTTGTMTDTLGRFRLQFPTLTDTLHFTAIGYKTVDKLLPREDMQTIQINMQPETFDISEVQVAPDEGPMRELFRHIMDRKSSE